ncbi:I78 family peptidase inhibitor [Herbaspirillum sp. DW155]|uniref:I78 family peptidase inhibitor n=1 Tax=Herbaspirillum sp. DW155 TaxID=3095609 RepID=UPI003089DEF4|nr:I78 family peptidase inhibitor [Herbaspirillum sp. DW155]
MPYYPSPSPARGHSPALKAALATVSLGAVLIACSASRETPGAQAGGGQCDASRADHLIGENYSGYIERQALAESGATDIRVLKPGDAATMDFNPRRLNLHVDPGLVIIQVACG